MLTPDEDIPRVASCRHERAYIDGWRAHQRGRELSSCPFRARTRAGKTSSPIHCPPGHHGPTHLSSPASHLSGEAV